MNEHNIISIPLIQNFVNDTLNKMFYETRHGHLLHYKDGNMSNDNNDNLEFISIDKFFTDKNYIEKTDWKWGLKKDEVIFVYEYWEYFNYKNMVSKYV